MDARYFRLLEEFGITCDCSFTPGVSWTSAEGESVDGGCDYRYIFKGAQMIGNVLELPMTIRRYKHYLSTGNIKHQLRTLVKGGAIWLRPALNSLSDMKRLIKDVDSEPGNDYLEFMIHSSELMPGGSPYFKDEIAIDRMYNTMNQLFDYVRKLGYYGETLENFTNRHMKL
jgi:hypothetical protein